MITTDDATAIHILRTIAKARLQPIAAEPTSPDAADLRVALVTAFGDSPQGPASQGDLARAALDLLAQDPIFAEPINIMAQQAATAPPQRYLDPTGIALTTAALLVLQTRVKFKRDSKGKWSLEIDKKSASDSTLKLLAQRLLSFLDSKP